MDCAFKTTQGKASVSPSLIPVAMSGARWDNGDDSRLPAAGSYSGMKLCPICATSYPAGHRTCPTHGAVLVDTPELAPGTMVRECYRIERTLGKGGMGTVYLAEHTLMGEPRALKFLSGALAANPLFVQRFLQEARAASKLHHPNIAQTMELGQTEDGSFYISMEYVNGPTLRALLEQSPRGLPPERVFNIVRGVAEALGAAHAKRMVHRDIKPENILLAWTTEAEIAKVVDFGIVAMADSVGRLTQTGRPLLTAEYAAPEQWRGVIPASELDGRTDLYSLGIMFYEMLTGRLPFRSDSYEGWFEQHVYAATVPPSQVRPELSRYPGLDALVMQLLAKEREYRPANVYELLAALDRVMAPADHSQTVRTDPSQRKQTMIEVPVNPGPRTVPQFVPSGQMDAQTFHAMQQDAAQKNLQPPPRKVRGKGLLIAFLGLIAAVIVVSLVILINNARHESGGTTTSGSGMTSTDTSGSVLPARPTIPQPHPADPLPSINRVPTDSVDPNSTAKSAIALYNQKQYALAEPLFERACDEGHADSCDYLGWMYQHQLGVAQDYSRARDLYHKACDSGSFAGCNNLGYLYQARLGVAQDYGRANELYTRACNGQLAAGCDNLGNMYENKLGVAQDYGRAATYYQEACNRGSMDGCKSLGWFYENNLGVPRNYDRAVSLFNKACTGNNMEACNDLGFMYQHKIGVAQNYPLAQALFTKACNGDNATACNNLGVMYQDSQGVAPDYSRAATLYAKACDGGNANGCSDLGDLYRTGNGVPKDSVKARELLSKGCAMGNTWGCEHLKMVQ